MQFTCNGKPYNVAVKDYLIDWDKTISKPQKKVKDFLFPFWKNHVCLEEFKIPRTLLRIDLMNLTRRIAVEVSPEATHREYNKHFHAGNRMNYVNTLKRDAMKEEWIKANRFTFIELYDEDINNLSIELFYTKFDTIL